MNLILRVAAKQAIRTVAPNSLRTKPSLVQVSGLGKVWAEPPDGDDTFPPAIKSYEFIDGWLVYHGRDGSMGVIVGKIRELEKWISDVDFQLKAAPHKETRLWLLSDGGEDNIRKATVAAKKVFRSIRLEFLFREGTSVEGAYGGGEATVVNAHLDETIELGGSRVHAGSKTAAHEAAHAAYSHSPDKGKTAIQALKDWGKGVSVYHGLAGDFEGIMEAAAWWALNPSKMKHQAPELFEAVTDWLT